MEETTPSVQSPNSKKWLWIGLGVVAVLILGSLVTGAIGRGTGFGAAYFTPGVDVDQNMDGTVTYTSEDGKGSVTVGTGAGMPDNWPSDAPTVYDGATILYSGTTNPTTGEAGSAVSYTTSASMASIVEYYESRLKAEGWTIAGSIEAGGMRAITATKDARTIGVYVGSDGKGTTGVTAGVQF